MIRTILVNNCVTLVLYAISIIVYFFMFFTLEWKWKLPGVVVEITLFGIFALVWFLCGYVLTGFILRKDSVPMINFLSVSSVFIIGVALWIAVNVKLRFFGNYILSRGDLSVMFPHSNILNEIFGIHSETSLYVFYMIIPSLLFFLGIQLKK